MPDLPSALELARTVRGQHRALVEQLLRDGPLIRANVSHLSTYFDEMARVDLIGEADRAVLDEILTALNMYLGAPRRDPVLERLVDALTTSYSQLSSRADVSPVALVIAGTALDSAEAAAVQARSDDPDEEPSGGGGGGGGGVGVGDATLVADVVLGGAGCLLGFLVGGPLGAVFGGFFGGVAGSVVTAESRKAAGIPN